MKIRSVNEFYMLLRRIFPSFQKSIHISQFKTRYICLGPMQIRPRICKRNKKIEKKMRSTNEFEMPRLKKFMILFVLHVPWVFYLAFVGVRSAETHLQPNLYHTLGGKTFHLFWLKVPVPQGRPAPLCSETAWPISQKNEWVDDFFFAFLWFFC